MLHERKPLTLEDLRYIFFRVYVYDRRYNWQDVLSASHHEFDVWIRSRVVIVNDTWTAKHVWSEEERLYVCNELWLKGMLRVYMPKLK